MARRALQRLASLPQVVTDGALAAVLLASALLNAYESSASVPPGHVLTIALITLPVAVRRVWPRAITLIIGTGLLLNLLVGFENSFVENFAILLALYTMYSRARMDWQLVVISVIVAAGVGGGIVLGWIDEHRVVLSDIPYNAIIFIVPVSLAYGVRNRQAYLGQVQQRAELAAEQAAARERTAIARDLHDVIAHSVSVMVLQATAAARVARRDPAEAAGSFDVIEHTGRSALADLRRVVGLLKSDAGAAADLMPQPGLDQIEPLVDAVRSSGVSVRLIVDAHARALPPGVELCAYRIVQESLTNVLKHSDQPAAEVRIAGDDASLVVTVCDRGTTGRTESASGGNGLNGMRERVTLLHGEFSAGQTEHGFMVTARLPLEADDR